MSDEYRYLAGPMTGKPEHNVPVFRAATRDLKRRGIKVWNPALADLCDPNRHGKTPAEFSSTHSYAYFMARDLPAVCKSVGVINLPGWEASPGACFENITALFLGLPSYAYHGEGVELELIPRDVVMRKALKTLRAHIKEDE